MTIKFVQRDTGEISLTAFIGQADKKSDLLNDLVVVMLTSLLFVIYLAYFSVKKFRRIKAEKIIFEKIKKINNKEEVLVDLARKQAHDREFLKGNVNAVNQAAQNAPPIEA